jgi:type VI secretion system Hcp family effector
MVILKIPGVPGQFPGNPCEADLQDGIELSSISWGSSMELSESGGTFSAGTTKFDRVNFMKILDKATGPLMTRCATGEKFDNARIYYLRSGAAKGMYVCMKLELSKIVVSGYNLNGSSGSGDPVESISFSPAKIKFTYFQITETGQTGAAVPGSWDISESHAE